MEYKEILQALRDYSEFIEVSSQKFNDDIISGSENTDAGFEEIICNYIDALNEIKRIRNRNKRLCLVYDALGYEQFMIAEILHIAQQTVSKYIKWLKRFFSK